MARTVGVGHTSLSSLGGGAVGGVGMEYDR